VDTNLLIKGVIIGFSIAAPVGPIGVLVTRRTLASGRIAGLLSGLGAATADGLYGAVAAFGLTFISNIIVGQQFWIRLIGGIFLLYLGIKTFFAKSKEGQLTNKERNLTGNYFSTLFLTITNPTTILSFAAVFAGLGLGVTNANILSATLMVLGVLIGSAFWWLILSGGVNLFRSKFNAGSLVIVNRISGLILIMFAMYAFYVMIRH